MFEHLVCESVNEATAAVKKILAEASQLYEFQVIHSLSETECTEDGGDWNECAEILLSYIRELDATQGYMMYDNRHGGFWDFISWDAPDPERHDECFVHCGEGLVVIHNVFALCEGEFPVVVVKKSFWDQFQKNALEMLKYVRPMEDYTAKVSPAVYVELFLL